MKLTSPAFADGQEMAQKHGKKIDNVSLPLSWSEVPVGVKSFALTIIDCHPVARGYSHWIVSDINAEATELKENAAANGNLPAGTKELKPYTGPFPPSGTHDYEITLYALNVENLGLPSKANVEAFTQAVKQCTLATATLTGKFTKVKP